MWCEHALVMLAETSAGDALAQLEGVSDRALVVVHGESSGEDFYYVFDAGSIRIASRRLPPTAALESALDLHEWASNNVVQLTDHLSASPGDVVLRGRAVAGVAMDIPVTRGGPSDRGDSGGGPSIRGTSGEWGNAKSGRSGDDGGSFGWNGGDVIGGGPSTPPAASRPGAPRSRFRAFPALSAPGGVVVGERFMLIVGFSRERRGEEDLQPVLIADAPPVLEFVVQIAGFGFSYPEGIRRDLRVRRDDPESLSVSFAVVAEPVRDEVVRVMEVSYEYHGELCGLAWQEVRISAVRAPQIPDARGGGTGVVVGASDESTPDLTVEIHHRDGDPELEWIFHPRYADLERPAHRVANRLGQQSAESFAIQIMNQFATGEMTSSSGTTRLTAARTSLRISLRISGGGSTDVSSCGQTSVQLLGRSTHPLCRRRPVRSCHCLRTGRAAEGRAPAAGPIGGCSHAVGGESFVLGAVWASKTR